MLVVLDVDAVKEVLLVLEIVGDELVGMLADAVVEIDKSEEMLLMLTSADVLLSNVVEIGEVVETDSVVGLESLLSVNEAAAAESVVELESLLSVVEAAANESVVSGVLAAGSLAEVSETTKVRSGRKADVVVLLLMKKGTIEMGVSAAGCMMVTCASTSTPCHNTSALMIVSIADSFNL